MTPQDSYNQGQYQAAEPSAAPNAYQPLQEGKKKKKKGGVWRVVFWISLIVFLGAIAALGYIGWGYFSADKGYQEVATQAIVAEEKDFDAAIEAGLSLNDLEVDWDYLRSVNPAVVAWVYMPGTRINYPVVQGKDNDEYLWTDFNLQSSRCGSIFLDAANNPAFTDMNNVMYGHHMNDGSMFACISNELASNEEFNKHRTVYVLTPQLNYKCTSFSVVITDGWDLLVQTTFKDEEERTSYVQDKIDRSVVQPSEGMPTAKDVKRLFTFSTCDYTRDNGRAVLFTQVVDTAVPKGAVPQGSSSEHSEVAEEDLAALEEGVSVADQ